MDRAVIRWPAMALAVLAIVGFFAWLFWCNHVDMSATTSREAALQQTITRLQNDQIALTNELAQVGTTSYIESRARTDYSYIKPGELRFEVVNPECLQGYTEAELQILMQEMIY